MGVVVLQGDAQAHLIEDALLNIVGAEEMEKRRLVCGNPYSFQGDERDIMFLWLYPNFPRQPIPQYLVLSVLTAEFILCENARESVQGYLHLLLLRK